MPHLVSNEGIHFLKFNVEIYHNQNITMSKCVFSIEFGVDLGNLTRSTIEGVCVKWAMILRTRPEQHFSDQLN
jgi:hypothetical protein